MLGGPKTIRGDLLARMRRLATGGIRMHAQIVLCPGLNDGAHLARTVRDLSGLHPAVATIAVVPVMTSSLVTGPAPFDWPTRSA